MEIFTRKAIRWVTTNSRHRWVTRQTSSHKTFREAGIEEAVEVEAEVGVVVVAMDHHTEDMVGMAEIITTTTIKTRIKDKARYAITIANLVAAIDRTANFYTHQEVRHLGSP